MSRQLWADEKFQKKEYNNFIPLETEYRIQFILTNLVLYELFFLISPEEIKIDLERLIATDAIYYAYHCACGNCMTSKMDINEYLDNTSIRIAHPWLKLAWKSFKTAIFGGELEDVYLKQ